MSFNNVQLLSALLVAQGESTVEALENSLAIQQTVLQQTTEKVRQRQQHQIEQAGKSNAAEHSTIHKEDSPPHQPEAHQPPSKGTQEHHPPETAPHEFNPLAGNLIDDKV